MAATKQPEPPTPTRSFRPNSLETWASYGAVCEAEGITRSDDLRQYVERRVRDARVEATA